MSLFLTPDQVEQLTGCKRPADQCQWLTDHGYRHERNRANKPVVLVAEIESRLLSTRRRRTLDGPDLDAMNAA